MGALIPKVNLEQALMDEFQAREFLGASRVRLGQRVMDPKAQLVAEFIKSIRVPGYFPPLTELRQQLARAVQILDEPAPTLARKEDLTIPAQSGAIPARLYASSLPESCALPVLAYFHGGGWVQGDLETHDSLCTRLALWSGAMVVAIDYRLAPEHKFPAAVDDCCTAYQWLRTHGGEIGADPTRVGVAGDSAGGNLAAVVCQQTAGIGAEIDVTVFLQRPPDRLRGLDVSRLGSPDEVIVAEIHRISELAEILGHHIGKCLWFHAGCARRFLYFLTVLVGAG